MLEMCVGGSSVIERYDVIILGAGASGLFCAFTAAERGRSVLVLEKANKVGKKILMSGGGRCNFTNMDVTADNFVSQNSHFSKSALKRYTQWDFISMVSEAGIEYEERKHSQLFCKNTAKDILNMLLSRCEKSGVQIKTRCDVLSVFSSVNASEDGSAFEQNGVASQGYCVRYIQGEKESILQCKSLVVATGALSIPTLGGSGYGYELAKQFDLKITQLQAGLVPFMFSGGIQPMCERLSGLSLEVSVTSNAVTFNEQLLFTHRGMSGPVILQVSNYWFPGDEVVINLLPSIECSDWLLRQKKEKPKAQLKTVLSYLLPKALVSELQAMWWAAYAEKPLADYPDKLLLAVARKMNSWAVKPSATEGYRTAEVTLGGVHTDSISSKTMEVKKQPGLFFIGEVVDVTGHLGGFNFQWAWSSGYTAGLFV